MSNLIYKKGLFNEEQKNMYLKDLPKNTKTAYLRVLNRARALEERLNKDLYDFNIYEIENLMYYLSPKTLNSATSSISIIQNYIRWAIEQDLRTDNLNPLDAVFGNEFIKKFIDSTNKIIFSENEINDVIGGLVNFQDSAVVVAIFEGILGKHYSELLNLTWRDIDTEKKEIFLKNENGNGGYETRIFTVKSGSLLLRYLQKAYEEKVYYKQNGNPKRNIKSQTADLIDNDYVFRNALLNTKESNRRADQHLILRRLKRISEWYGQPYFNAINIRNSGMLKMAKDLYERDGELEKKQYDEICDRFNIQKNEKTGLYNIARIKKDFLNLTKIKEVYDI